MRGAHTAFLHRRDEPPPRHEQRSTVIGPTKLGAGPLTLAGTQTYDTVTTLAGTTKVDRARGIGVSILNANGGATNLRARQTLAALKIARGKFAPLQKCYAPRS